LAHERLIDRNDPEYVGLSKTLNDVVVPFSEMFFAVPESFPASKVEHRFHEGFIRVAARRKPQSSGFLKLDSSLTDGFHAQNAAYCEVFTCDKLTSECLGGVREDLGLLSEIVFHGGDFASFEEKLASAVRLRRPPIPIS